MCGTETTTARVHKANGGLSNGTRPPTSAGPVPNSAINLDQGDPALFAEYWKEAGDRCDVAIRGSELMSYFSNPRSLCWFLLPELEDSIRRIHRVTGNAKTEGSHLIVGNGSTQLIAALLYALSSTNDMAQPVSVVCAAPYYSCYRELADLLKSRLYEWGGDANTFDGVGPYVEMVTTPNNPDGSIRGPVVNQKNGKVVYDLAYYWPQYTAITEQLDHDIMLFTFSKCTGHAGSRIGWAIVKDEKVARRMIKYMEVMSIGVSKEGQFRAAKLLNAVCDGCEGFCPGDSVNFFEYSKQILMDRWEKLRKAVSQSDVFTLPKFSKQYCRFSAEFKEAYPAFAWVKCKDELKDAQSVLNAHNILVRGGTKFGVDPTYARVSMVSKEDAFNSFIEKISTIRGSVSNGNNAL